MLDALIERLHQTTAVYAAFELAAAQLYLGRIYQQAGHAERAIPILSEAAGAWGRLVRQAANLSPSATIEGLLTSDTQEAKQRREACAVELNNLSTALGDLANALRAAGRLDEALSTAEQSVDIPRALGSDHHIVSGLGRIAQILMEQGRYQEADARYNQALDVARRLGDQALEGAFLQHQGFLAGSTKQYNRAIDLYKQALRRFQAANDDDSIMKTCNLLGIVEQNVGRLSEARAWYERSREIAKHRGDTASFGTAAQNIGIVCQLEGKAAWQHGDEVTARQRFAEAERFLQESLRMNIDRQDKRGEAGSLSQMSRVYLIMGELDKAEAHAHQAREIDEDLGMIRELPSDYYILAQIARARGDEARAAQWEAKGDKVEAELARRARGGDAANAGLPQQMLQAITQLAVACVQAGVWAAPGCHPRPRPPWRISNRRLQVGCSRWAAISAAWPPDRRATPWPLWPPLPPVCPIRCPNLLPSFATPSAQPQGGNPARSQQEILQ